MKIADKKSASGEAVVDGLAEAFGGEGIKTDELCVIDPEKAAKSLEDLPRVSYRVSSLLFSSLLFS